MDLTKEWTAPYAKRTKHRKKCRVCGKLIEDGATVIFRIWSGQRMTTTFMHAPTLVNVRRVYVTHTGCNGEET
jgi:hypothetical protein